MQPHLKHGDDILAVTFSRLDRALGSGAAPQGTNGISCMDHHDEAMANRVVANNEHQPNRQVPARDQAEHIYQERSAVHAFPQADVVAVPGISAPVAIAQQVVALDIVLVGTVRL